MPPITVRSAVRKDLPRLTDIYNHYVVNTPVTFDLKPFTAEQRIPWFNEHSGNGRYRMLVAVEPEGRIVGCAATGRIGAKEAYETTVEVGIYCDHAVTGRGIGTALYSTLFESLQDQDINRIVGGITQPNVASVALHLHFGFRHVGTFTGNGRKFGQYWDVAWFERPLKLSGS